MHAPQWGAQQILGRLCLYQDQAGEESFDSPEVPGTGGGGGGGVRTPDAPDDGGGSSRAQDIFFLRGEWL